MHNVWLLIWSKILIGLHYVDVADILQFLLLLPVSALML